MRAAIYARVSSAAQRDAHTIENQLRVLPAYVAAQGWQIVGTYVDDGRSAKAGKLEARDGFARLVRDAEQRKFDILVVVDIDRLTRTDDMLERAQILGPFQKAGIDIVTPSGGRFDLRSLTGELYVTLQAQFAAEENRKRAERIRAGKLRAIAEGRKPAGPTPYGLAYSRATGSWSIDEPAAAIVREIFDRVVAGETCAAIAVDLHARGIRPPRSRGQWQRHNVHQIVRKRYAVGEWVADKRQRLMIQVPAIIDEETWEAAQDALLAHGKRGLVKTRHVYLLEGLGVCATCGSQIRIRASTRGTRGGVSPAAYVCRRRQDPPLGVERCTAPIVHVRDADERVWARISEVLQDPGLVDAIERRQRTLAADAAGWRSDAEEWRRKLAKLDRHEAALLARFRRDQISEAALDVELAAVARERSALRVQLAAADRAMSDTGSEAASVERIAVDLRELAGSATTEERQRVVRALVRRGGAVFDQGRVKLTLRVQLAQASAQRSAASSGCRRRNERCAAEYLRIRLVA